MLNLAEMQAHLERVRIQREAAQEKLYNLSEHVERLKIREAVIEEEIQQQQLLEQRKEGEFVVTVFRFPPPGRKDPKA